MTRTSALDTGKDVFPSWGRYSPAELTEMIDRLLDAHRPRAAFHAVHMNINDIETSRLKRLLRDVATVNAEPLGHFRLDSYYISEALNSLDGRPGVTPDEMAQLEFLYIDILDDSKHGIPNLERQIAQSPALFFQAVALTYKRSDEGEDPPELRIANPEQQVAVALTAHRLLDQIKMIPGTDENGTIDAAALTAWLAEVRRLCHEYARADIGDHCLGQLLAKAPEGENGIWPCEAVCEAMEAIASPEIARGFDIGVYNSRGVYSPGEGGEQSASSPRNTALGLSNCNTTIPMSGGSSRASPRPMSAKPGGMIPKRRSRRGFVIEGGTGIIGKRMLPVQENID